MESLDQTYSPIVDDLASSTVSGLLPQSTQYNGSPDQPVVNGDIVESLLLGPDSHRTHVTDTQFDDPDQRPERSSPTLQEHSSVDDITNPPFRSASQQRNFKAMFTRPVSAKGDIQQGFTFGKAPPLKALDPLCGRKPDVSAAMKLGNPTRSESLQSIPNPGQAQQQNGSSPPSSMGLIPGQEQPSLRPVRQAALPPGDHNVQLQVTAPTGRLESEMPPEPDSHPSNIVQHEPPNTPTAQKIQSAIPKDILPILRTGGNSAMGRAEVKATQVGTTNQQEWSVSEAHRLPGQTERDVAGADILPLHNKPVAGNITATSLGQSRPTHLVPHKETHMPTSNIPRESLQPRTKVTKRKSNTKKKSIAAKAPLQSIEESEQESAMQIATEPATTEGELLETLYFRYKTQQRERKIEQTKLMSTNAELARAQNANGTLQTRLQEMQRRAEMQQAELNNKKSTMSAWQAKIGKLTNHINGLCNDHAQLRQDSIRIRQQQNEIGQERANIDITMSEVQQSVKDRNLAELAKVKAEAGHRIRLLEQTVETQERQLQEDWDLLRTERERNQRLDDEIIKFSDKHDELMRSFVGHRQTTSRQLNELLTTCEIGQIGSDSDNNVQIKTQLDECTRLITKLHDSDRVNPGDLQKLNDSVRSYAEQITKTMEKAIKQSSDRTSDVEARQTFESEVLSKLGSLSAGLKSEYTLSEQVAELREMKATIRERLQASEIALADARQHCLGLQQKEQLLMQRVSSLEVEAATLRSQSRDSPDAMLREQELKDKNTQLQVDITQAQKDASEAADRSQGQERSLAEQQEQIDCLNTQLEEMQASLTTLHEEKSTSEEQAAARYDDIRDQVLKAATMEKTKLSNEHANRLHQLKQQKNKVDSQVEELSRQLADLKTAEGNKSETSSKLRAQSANLEIQNAEKDKRLASLQEKVRQAEEVTQSKVTEIQAISEAKAGLQREAQSKDAEIQALFKAKTREMQEHKSTKESLAAATSEVNAKAEQTFARMTVLLRNFDPNTVLPDTLADAMTYLSTVLIEAKQNRVEVLEAKAAAANFKRSASSDLKAPLMRSGSPNKQKRRANRGIPDTNRVEHTSEDALQREVVVRQSQVKETTFHSRNVKTTFSSLGADNPRIVPFSQVGQIEFTTPSSPLGDVSELFPPTPVHSNKQPEQPPVHALRRPSHEIRQENNQSRDVRDPGRTQSRRRISVQDSRPSSGHSAHNLASKRMPEWKPSSLGEKPMNFSSVNTGASRAPIADKQRSSVIKGQRSGYFEDLTTAGAAFGRMKTTNPQIKYGRTSGLPTSPMSILKESKSLKRDATAAGFEAAGSNSRPATTKRVSEPQRFSLGPIIGDSQSPRKATRGNGRRKRASKDEEYTQRFSQELN